MNAAVNGGTYKQQYPIDSDSPVYVKDIDASGLWKKLFITLGNPLNRVCYSGHDLT